MATPPPRSPPQPPGPRNQLGTVTLVIAVCGALFAVIPATAVLGFLLCLIAIIPAIFAYRRIRKGTATNRGPSLAALVVAPLFLVVALSVGIANTPSPLTTITTTAGNGTPLAGSAITAAPDSAASAPALNASNPAPAFDLAPPPAALVPAAAPAPAAAPPPAPAPAPAASAPVAAPPDAGSACDDATHYRNVDGNCVLRPVSGSAPPGATAKCVDGTYSSSQHRQGTCSRHGGVAQ